MFRPFLLWPSSGRIHFLSEKLYRYNIEPIISVGKGERDLVLHKVSGCVRADGKEPSIEQVILFVYYNEGCVPSRCMLRGVRMATAAMVETCS